MTIRFLFALGVFFLIAPTESQAAKPAEGLKIYFVDTVGGAATLIVTPVGESLLIDCGNPGKRDAERIHQTATQLAGLKAIDHLFITHWHLDHYGGINRLAQLMPIRNFYDRGIPKELPEDAKNFKFLIQAYKKASAGKSKALKAGDEITLRQSKHAQLRLLCLCANTEVIGDAKGATPNPFAKEHKAKPEDKSDNAKSLGFLLTYGDFKFLDLGDLTWNIEYKLVAPTNKIGLVDVYQVTHHGLEISNNPVLIKTVRPRVAVFNNGPTKGCHPQVTSALRRVSSVKAIYQMHKNIKAGDAENTQAAFIANKDKAGGKGIVISVNRAGTSYSVTVGDKGKPWVYQARGKVTATKQIP